MKIRYFIFLFSFIYSGFLIGVKVRIKNNTDKVITVCINHIKETNKFKLEPMKKIDVELDYLSDYIDVQLMLPDKEIVCAEYNFVTDFKEQNKYPMKLVISKDDNNLLNILPGNYQVCDNHKKPSKFKWKSKALGTTVVIAILGGGGYMFYKYYFKNWYEKEAEK